MSLVCAALNTFVGFGLPRSIPGIWAAVFVALAVFSRLVLLEIIDQTQDAKTERKNVLVYGAGATGRQLAAALRSSRELRPVGFLDDNPSMKRVEVWGIAGLAALRPARPDQAQERITGDTGHAVGAPGGPAARC